LLLVLGQDVGKADESETEGYRDERGPVMAVEALVEEEHGEQRAVQSGT